MNRKELIEVLLKDTSFINKYSTVVRTRRANDVAKFGDKFPEDNKLIDALGGNKVLAEVLNVVESTISYYRRAGIPISVLAQLRVLQLGV